MSSEKKAFEKKGTSSSTDSQGSSRGNQDFAAQRYSKQGSELREKTLINNDQFKLKPEEKEEKITNWARDQHERLSLGSLYPDENEGEKQSQEQPVMSSESPKAETFRQAFMGTLRRTFTNTSKDFNKRLEELAVANNTGTFSADTAYFEEYEFGGKKVFEEFNPNEELESHPNRKVKKSYLDHVATYNDGVRRATFAIHDINVIWKNLEEIEKSEPVTQEVKKIREKIEKTWQAAMKAKEGFQQSSDMQSYVKLFVDAVEELQQCASDLWKASQKPDHLEPLFQLEASIPRLKRRSTQGEANAHSKRYDELANRGDAAIEKLEDFLEGVIARKQSLADKSPYKITKQSADGFVCQIEKIKKQIKKLIDYNDTVTKALGKLPSTNRDSILTNFEQSIETAEQYVSNIVKKSIKEKRDIAE